MSKLLEEFLKIQTYEEYDRRREEFRELFKVEERARKHLVEISPQIGDTITDGIIREVF